MTWPQLHQRPTIKYGGAEVNAKLDEPDADAARLNDKTSSEMAVGTSTHCAGDVLP